MPYRLTRKAEDDIIGIYRESVRLFGSLQADSYHQELQTAFELIGDHPLVARVRVEIDPPVRVYPCKSHIIIYLVEGDGVPLIIRVRHGREDWLSQPS